MFVVPETWTFWTTVQVALPGQDPSSFEACFAIPSHLTWDSFLQMQPKEALSTILIDWKDVVDAHSKPIAFADTHRREQLLSLPFISRALVVSLLEAIDLDIEKN